MVFPSDQFARGIDSTLEVMEAAGTVIIVLHVVFAGPDELDWRFHALGDGADFDHVIVIEATSEGAAGAQQMNGDVGFGNAEFLGHEGASAGGKLAGAPDDEFAILIMRAAVAGFERRVRDERVGVGGFKHLGRAF